MDAATPAHGPAGRLRSWYVLALLFAVYVTNMADRQIVGILAEPIKRDLHLSDGQLGLLAGPAIAFFYAILGVPMAYAADRINRVRFIAACLTLWSVMTMLGARAASLLELAATRIGVSIAEAGGSPSSVSLIADHFGLHRRATAMAIWTAGSTVGIFVGFALGGTINQWLGWRATFVIVGLPGIALALLLLLTVREPVRGSADSAPPAPVAPLSMARTFAFLWRIKLLRQCIGAAVGCNFCVFAVLTWAPAFAVRSYGVGTAEVGTVMGGGIAIAGGSMMVLSGIGCDLLGRKGPTKPVIAVAAMLAISALAFALAFRAPDFRSFAILFTIAYAALMTNPPIIWVVLQANSPPAMRAMATAVMLLAIALFATVPAPLLVGLASDALRPVLGVHGLGVALLLAPAAVALAAIQFLFAARTARDARAGDAIMSPHRPDRRPIGI